MNEHIGEKRSEERILTNERVVFTASQSERDIECRGVVINRSSAGMKIYHYCSLREGDRIRLMDSSAGRCYQGVVRWTRKIDDISGLAGVYCLET